MSLTIDRKSLALGSAAGLGLGLVANLLRKVAVQAPTAFAGNWDEALAAEHDAALTLIDALLETEPEEEGRRTVLLTQLKHAIGKHALQEENAIYPTLRKHGLLPSEEELTHEHAEVKAILFELTRMKRSDPAWIDLVSDLRVTLESHMKDEEENVFPQLRAKLSDSENALLTEAMNREGFKLA